MNARFNTGGHRRDGVPPIIPDKRPVMITGGAGFIGTNLAHHYLSAGQPVLVLDDLSRPGVERNLEWLRKTHGELLRVEVGKVQNFNLVRRAARHACKVFHFAAQVAVTTSLLDPIHDFEVNARGTLNLLEALRALPDPRPLIYTSTNKVYGDLADVGLRANENRFEPASTGVRRFGFNEDRPLRFHSPYGCSKGAACQYVLDYARTFKVPGVVFRMSCIYGWHQYGTEDQGWVAHFLIRALMGRPITIFGDGRQVRDILFVEDLMDAFLLAQHHMHDISGMAFNIGGGPDHTVSLLELVKMIATLDGGQPELHFEDWRQADQRWYVSDIRKFSSRTGWQPRHPVRDGIRMLWDWLRENRIPAPPARPQAANDTHPESPSPRINGQHSGHNGNGSSHNGQSGKNGSAEKRLPQPQLKPMKPRRRTARVMASR